MAKYYCILLDANQSLMTHDAVEPLRELAEHSTLAALFNGKKEVLEQVKNQGLKPYLEAMFMWDRNSNAAVGKKFFEYVLHNLGVEHAEHVLVVSDNQEGILQEARKAGLAGCWFNTTGEQTETFPAEYAICSWEELYPIVMEKEELDMVGVKKRRHAF